MIGLLPWVALAVVWSLSGTAWLGVPAGIATYGVLCAVYPWVRCPRCRGVKVRGDGKGHVRPRNCRRCSGSGHVRRWGAIVLGLERP